MSNLGPLSEVKRKSHFEAVRSPFDPTRTSGPTSDCVSFSTRRPVAKC